MLPAIKANPQVPDTQKQALEKMPGSTPIVVQTMVKLGVLQNNVYPVLAGLKRGDQVVVSNTALLRSGMPVRIAGMPPAN